MKSKIYSIILFALICLLLFSSCSKPDLITNSETDSNDSTTAADGTSNNAEETEYTDLTWISDKGAAAFYNDQISAYEQSKDSIVYYDFETMKYKVYELPINIRGYIYSNALFISGEYVIGFTARACDPDGTNHITDDGLENNLVLWNIVNDELSFVSLDPEYYLYSYKLMVSDNDKDHLYALGCLKDNKEIQLLEIDIHSGKITSLGKYNDNQINEKPYSEQKVIGEQDGYVYYLGSAEKSGEGISQALYRYKGNEEEIVIEDLYHSNELSISIGTFFSIIDNKLYYTDYDRTAEETYSFEADLTTGEVSYKKGYIGKITGKYQDHLIIISNDAPMGIIGEYNMPFAINEEEYLKENPEIIYFEPSGQNE